MANKFICPFCFQSFDSELPTCPSCGKTSPLPSTEPQPTQTEQKLKPWQLMVAGVLAILFFPLGGIALRTPPACGNCGALIPEGATSCPACNTEFDSLQPVIGRALGGAVLGAIVASVTIGVVVLLLITDYPGKTFTVATAGVVGVISLFSAYLVAKELKVNASASVVGAAVAVGVIISQLDRALSTIDQ